MFMMTMTMDIAIKLAIIVCMLSFTVFILNRVNRELHVKIETQRKQIKEMELLIHSYTELLEIEEEKEKE